MGLEFPMSNKISLFGAILLYVRAMQYPFIGQLRPCLVEPMIALDVGCDYFLSPTAKKPPQGSMLGSHCSPHPAILVP
jgi:hypothetical protein